MIKFLVLICVIKITLEDNLEANKLYNRSFSKEFPTTITEICKTKKILSNLNIEKTPCCQTCDACYHKPLNCCCNEKSCHPIAIQCDSSTQNTDWYIKRNDSKENLQYRPISSHLFVQTSIYQLLNLKIEDRGDSQASSIVIVNPNHILSNYVITAICNTKIILQTQITVDGLYLEMKNSIEHYKCNPNVKPCKLIFCK
jgi:hypothetical protein